MEVAQLDTGVLQADRRQPSREALGVDGDEGVVLVAGADEVQIEGVLADEDAAGTEDPPDFGEESVLVLGGGHVVEDRETGHRREPIRLEPALGGVGADDLDARAGQAPAKRSGQCRVHLDGGEMGHAFGEQVGRETGTGPDLQDVVTEVPGGLDPGQQVGFEHLRPSRAGEEVDVGLVHVAVVRSRAMAVSARPAKQLPETDTTLLVDMRSGGWLPAGSFVYQGDRLVTGWHCHDLHQIEYGISGIVEVETESAHFLLPPQQAAWVPAGLVHETTINTAVESVSVFFDTDLVPYAGDRARILAVPPLIREMIIAARRWPIDQGRPDPLADIFFRTLGLLVSESLSHEAPLSFPRSFDPVVAAATAFVEEHLRTVTLAQVSREVGVSERTLRRALTRELGMSWRNYLLRVRLLRAMAELAQRDGSITQVALTVGFESPSAFTRAFVRWSGETPSSYRRRVDGS